jgi:hypothetical protein
MNESKQIKETGNATSGRWRCLQCEKILNQVELLDGANRWGGDHWQHYHGYPAGYMRMERVVETVE